MSGSTRIQELAAHPTRTMLKNGAACAPAARCLGRFRNGGDAMRHRAHQVWLGLALVGWATACAAGFGALWVYGKTPGLPGKPAEGWRLPEPMRADDGRPTVVLFAHPRCPCTRATFSELERIQRLESGLFAIRVVFFEPEDADEVWRSTDLWTRALAWRDTRVIPDPGGRLGVDAGAETSGTIAVYDASGAVRFWGGITPARGHEGASPGQYAVRQAVRGRDPDSPTTSIYGCALRTPHTPDDLCDAEGCHAPNGG